MPGGKYTSEPSKPPFDHHPLSPQSVKPWYGRTQIVWIFCDWLRYTPYEKAPLLHSVSTAQWGWAVRLALIFL